MISVCSAQAKSQSLKRLYQECIFCAVNGGCGRETWIVSGGLHRSRDGSVVVQAVATVQRQRLECESLTSLLRALDNRSGVRSREWRCDKDK